MDDEELEHRYFDRAVVKVKKYVAYLPHDCPGGAACAFPDLEHVKVKLTQNSTQKMKENET